MAQGKEWNKEEVIETLRPYLQMGCSVSKACNYAGIPQSTVATWISDDEELRLKITAWQNEVNAKARKVWIQSIENNDSTAARSWLQAKEKEEFAERKEVTGGDGAPLFPDQETKEKVNSLIDDVLKP